MPSDFRSVPRSCRLSLLVTGHFIPANKQMEEVAASSLTVSPDPEFLVRHLWLVQLLISPHSYLLPTGRSRVHPGAILHQRSQ